ncbi:unnamed protein product [Didymodactylos carnosus]|uniref:Uncharacterized protein n=1 Tax=Didymodactylos carnosus TaxID=1234261 RepID=A0A814ZIU6_9BILA|nr:unnamed protein product [Didymodactylos carnosus]CAF4006276.1 unnamed protein product [Didymodactylos carnosus]
MNIWAFSYLLAALNKFPDGISPNMPEANHSRASALVIPRCAKHFGSPFQQQHDQTPLQLLASVPTTQRQ